MVGLIERVSGESELWESSGWLTKAEAMSSVEIRSGRSVSLNIPLGISYLYGVLIRIKSVLFYGVSRHSAYSLISRCSHISDKSDDTPTSASDFKNTKNEQYSFSIRCTRLFVMRVFVSTLVALLAMVSRNGVFGMH